MADVLEEIFTAIGARANEEWPLVYPDAPEITIEVTDDAVNYQQSPPRAVFYPQGEAYGTKDFASGDRKRGDTKPNPGQLYTRRSGVQVHVWGGSRTETEELLHAILRATYEVTFGSSFVNGGRWLSRSTTKLGNVYLLDLTFQIPVARLREPARPLTSFPTTTVIDRSVAV